MSSGGGITWSGGAYTATDVNKAKDTSRTKVNVRLVRSLKEKCCPCPKATWPLIVVGLKLKGGVNSPGYLAGHVHSEKVTNLQDRSPLT